MIKCYVFPRLNFFLLIDSRFYLFCRFFSLCLNFITSRKEDFGDDTETEAISRNNSRMSICCSTISSTELDVEYVNENAYLRQLEVKQEIRPNYLKSKKVEKTTPK